MDRTLYSIMLMKKGQRIVLTTPNGNYVLLVEEIRDKQEYREYKGLNMRNSALIIDEGES